MGFGLAVGAAILFTGITVAGYNVTGEVFDADRTLAQASQEQARLDAAATAASITVRDVGWDAGTITVVVRNTGSLVLDAARTDLLVDGVPASVDTRSIAGHAGKVWAPMQDLTVTLTGPSPQDVAVAANTGAMAFWRA